MKKTVQTDHAPSPLGPYSQGIKAGGLVFISGQTPIHPATGMIPDGIDAQTRQSLVNVQAIVEAAGCTMDNIVDVSVFLKDMNDFARMNAVYETFFTAPYPVRAAVEVARLPKDVLVEIKVTAVPV